MIGMFMMASCKEEEIREGDSWIEINPEVMKLDSIRDLWIIRYGSFVGIAVRDGDSIIGYDELDNFFGLDSNDVKCILNVLKDKNSVDVDRLKNALRGRLEWDRVVYELNVKQIKK
jgi:hypothetical protein